MQKPLNDNVLLEIEVFDKTKSGLVLPDSENMINERAKVIAVGPAVHQVSADDIVYFKSWAIDRVDIMFPKEEHYAFIKEELLLSRDE